MYIKKIKLFNFQKHESFETELSSGVNIFWGESRAGKSCIIRALKWVLFNEPKGDIIRKYGTEKTIVEVYLNDDIIVRKIKSSSINRYEVDKNGEVVKYDAIGKTIPEDIKNIFGMDTIDVDGKQLMLNVAPQISLPFLFSDTASFRMKVLNKLIGNDILDKVIQSFNRDIVANRAIIKNLTESIARDKEKLEYFDSEKSKVRYILDAGEECLSLLNARISVFRSVKSIGESIFRANNNQQSCLNALKEYVEIPNETIKRLKDKAEKISKVNQIYNSISTVKNKIDEVESIEIYELDSEKITFLKLKIDKLNNLNQYHVKIKSIIQSISETQSLLKQIGEVFDFDKLKTKVDIFNSVSQLFTKKNSLEAAINSIDLDIMDCDGQEKYLTEEYKSTLKKYNQCPTCHSPVTQEVLEKIVL